MTKRKPRKQDTRVTYTLQQTQRYKSQMSRYQKGLAIAAEHAVHKIDEETYRIPSVRAPDGYWQISRKPNKGIINIEWEGRKPNKGIINIEWEGRKPNKGIINVTWEGRKCRENPPPPDGPGGFPNLKLSGCARWGMLIAYPYKRTGPPLDRKNEPCSLDEVINSYRKNSGDYASSVEDILLRNGGTGFTRTFEYGTIHYHIGLGGFCDDGSPSDSYCDPKYGAGCCSVDITAPVYDPQSLLDSIGGNPTIIKIDPPSGNPTGECDLFDFVDSDSPPGSPPSCKRGTPVTWNCDYDLEAQEFSYNWSKISDNSIKNDRNYVKTLSPCPPPESLGSIKLKSINSVTSTEPDGWAPVNWNCDYNLEENEYSENWTIVSDDSIRNDKDYVKQLSSCPPPESIEDEAEIVNINSVISTEPDGWAPVNWDCDYNLEENEYSESWTIVSDDSIRNDRDYVKQLSPCPPPERIEDEVEIVNINSVDATEKGGYKCTCPDFSKKEGAFTPPDYPSMSQERSWESSNAGAPTWSDGKRRCCHIVAVQQVREEQIPLPTDM